MGREKLDTDLGELNTVKCKFESKLQGVLQKRGDSFVWLTDDDRRFPVLLEAKVKIGTVKVSIRSIEKGTPPEADPFRPTHPGG